jgi:hypothetical protein
MFTDKETALLIQVLTQLSIKPTQPDALELVTTIQSALSKLKQDQPAE